jgi:hypothetical protein
MRERVASTRSVGAARLAGWRLTLDKRGRDGSGKANIVRARAAEVWGAVYRIDDGDWRVLDRLEGGYERVALTVERAGDRLEVETYTSQLRTPDPVAFDWYRQLILDGAIEHGLPEAWIAALRALPVKRDPRRS